MITSHVYDWDFFHEEFCEVNKVKNAQKLDNVLIVITTIKQYVTEATRI